MKYEELTRILEEEKKTTLSRILPEFYSDVNEYIKELETADRNISKRHSEEAILIQYEIKNALSTIDKIFKKRTRKIIKMASARAFSKTPDNVTHDVELMTPQEQEVYHQMRNAILKYKDVSIDTALGNDSGKVPQTTPQAQDANATPHADITGTPNASEVKHPTAQKENAGTSQPGEIEVAAPVIHAEDVKPSEVKVDTGTESEKIESERKVENIVEKEVPEPPTTDHTPPARDEAKNKNNEPEKQETVESGKNDINKEYIVVRLLKDIPKFIGADGREYNPGAQDVAVLPKVNARALIKRKVAVQIESP
ncbi:MAG: DNA replication complex GINS family protein [Methanosarcinales archaeon]|nr:DNA replication complex GINS family protein [Methanosarcinales archaeon]